MSLERVDHVRRIYLELASGRLGDEVLGRYLDPEIEWVPAEDSPLGVESYRGFDGVRRFWGEFLSAWDAYAVEPLRFDDSGDQLAVVVRVRGRTHGLEVDETHSSLLTFRGDRIVRVKSFPDPETAREALDGPS